MTELPLVSNSDSSHIHNAIEPLYQVKLLSALRSGDPASIHPFLVEISKDRQKSTDGHIDTGAAALHLAIRCGSVSTVRLLLSHRAISPNGIHPPESGTTPLHLAACLGRVDVLNLLLEQENIDDSLRDNHGKTCRDIARGREVSRAIDDSRSFLNASYRSLLRSYILSPLSSPPPPTLIQLLESPRATFVDLSYLDDTSGTSLLHEAAHRKDLRLIELAVRAGADIFVRNRKGKMAHEGAGKDDRVKVFLRQFANHDKTLIPNPTPLTEPPVLKGYLNKYTNVAKGYNTRWFVLKGGVLSYYRHQDDETITSRGSISMKTAVLRDAERTRFEVHSMPSRSHHQHSGTQKWFMKANHPVEANRWTQAIAKNIEWYKMREATDSDASSIVGGGSILDKDKSSRRKSAESDTSMIRAVSLMHSQSLSGFWRRSAPGNGGTTGDEDSTTGDMDATDASPSNLLRNSGGVGPTSERGGPIADGVGYNEEEDGGDASSVADSENKNPPHPNIELQGNATAAQLELTIQMLANLSTSTATGTTPSSQFHETFPALLDSLQTTQSLLSEYTSMARSRDNWYARQLRKERARQDVWEESLKVVVREGEGLENELRKRSRNRGSRVFVAGSPAGTIIGGLGEGKKRRPSALGYSTAQELVAEESPSPISEGEPPPSAISPRSPPGPPISLQQQQEYAPPPVPMTIAARRMPPSRGAAADALVGSIPAITIDRDYDDFLAESVAEDEHDHDTDEEDEFFDAIEANALPNMLVHEALTSPASVKSPGRDDKGSITTSRRVDVGSLANQQGQQLISTKAGRGCYAGYINLRNSLKLSAERPNASLWSVLKHSIGKDLTKISFPVFFNEPTSMLQRMSEDMEYSECLDVATNEKDPLRRVAFVAAFAVASYSSTIGRIAKPFNPMLSETFEYVRLDKQYRYMSEQVSHHPPISACWAESPLWHYYGEVDAQNKFMGKSFEVKPTGVAHVNLLLPEEDEPTYPRAPALYGKDKVVEHFSWKKVTTSVSGFILGSPTIDHYGDMVVTNHRTGDQCILTFKPRGWRGRDAYEISGHVVDRRGRVAYEIAGRWNSQLVAKAVGVGGEQLHPDISVSGTTPSPEYILLWRNSEKPPGSPFNLTPFAITLNDCPLDTLKPYLCPTDCRLRPDQRAFELGFYELANGLKQAQEEKQRGIRKAREEGRMEPHRPRWFTAETDGDTGDRVWEPVRIDGNDEEPLEYWAERERVWGLGGNQKWKGVDDIFVEEPEVVTELKLQNQ